MNCTGGHTAFESFHSAETGKNDDKWAKLQRKYLVSWQHLLVALNHDLVETKKTLEIVSTKSNVTTPAFIFIDVEKGFLSFTCARELLQEQTADTFTTMSLILKRATLSFF